MNELRDFVLIHAALLLDSLHSQHCCYSANKVGVGWPRPYVFGSIVFLCVSKINVLQ